jgi:polysaccharide biosynthesis transport protein
MAETEVSASGFDLRSYLSILRRRKWIVVVTVLVAVAASLVASFLQTPIYEAESQIVIQTRSTADPFDQQALSSGDAEREAATAIEVIKSEPVRAEVEKKIGSAPQVSVAVVGETNVISIKARSTDAERATLIANAYAESYVSFKRTQAVNESLAATSQVRARVDDLQKEIDGLPEGGQRDALISEQAAFKSTLAQMQVRSSISSGGTALVSRAEVPTTPVEPQKLRSALLALALGLALGVGIAFAVDHLDDSITNVEALERATGGVVPVIALVPAFSEAKSGRSHSVVSFARQTSAAAEAYRSLRTSVQFMGLDSPIRLIQVTSPNPFEGKTTTVANLGVAIAGTGTRVAIVDLDLRRPRLHEVFELDNDKGFTSVLLGRVSLDDALQPISGTPVGGLAAVLPAGPVPPNPSELLSSPRVQKLLDELSERVDLVLLDSPPVLPVTDALVISRCADALILVTKAEVTTRGAMQRAIELLQQVGAPLRGLVMNGADEREFYGYGYGGRYGYGYGSGTESDDSVSAGRKGSAKKKRP